MTVDELTRHYPRLYHMAAAGSWPSIRRCGLLSTSALLDLFEIDGPQRTGIERARRPECVQLRHPKWGTAVIRDQKPMSEGALEKCLCDMTPAQWYELLNNRVFFWLSHSRLLKLLNARAYRSRVHCVLSVDTAALLKNHSAKATLSPINSGSTVYNPQPRGQYTFLRIDEYDFEAWRKKRGKGNAVVELAIDYSVEDIARYVTRVVHMKGTIEAELLWPK